MTCLFERGIEILGSALCYDGLNNFRPCLPRLLGRLPQFNVKLLKLNAGGLIGIQSVLGVGEQVGVFLLKSEWREKEGEKEIQR